jgi:hypothetical protein
MGQGEWLWWGSALILNDMKTTKRALTSLIQEATVVLTFDHLGDKLFSISSRIGCGNLPKLIEEIGKCVVRCANCHMRKTAKDFNWYTVRYKNGA